mgnify:CR=1 FL=1
MEQNVLDGMYEQLGISKEVLDYAADIEKSLKERFERIDQTAEYNQLKVLKGMQDNKSAISISLQPPVMVTMTLAVIH